MVMCVDEMMHTLIVFISLYAKHNKHQLDMPNNQLDMPNTFKFPQITHKCVQPPQMQLAKFLNLIRKNHRNANINRLSIEILPSNFISTACMSRLRAK